MTTTTLLQSDVTEQIIGAFYEVYRGLGFGFHETVYKNAFAIELGLRGLRQAREVPVEVHYKGLSVGTYRCDMLVNDCVIVEVKAIKALSDADERQLLNYLRATNLEVGLLCNVGPVPKYKRLVYSNDRKRLL